MSDEVDQLRTDYRRVFGSVEGRRVLRDLTRYCNVMIPVTSKYPESHTIAYAEGMRSVFWHVFGLVYDPLPQSREGETEGFDPLAESFVDMRKRE